MKPRTGRIKAAESFADLGILGSGIMVGSWVLSEFCGVDVPAEIQLNAGLLLMVVGGALARLVRHWWRYGR